MKAPDEPAHSDGAFYLGLVMELKAIPGFQDYFINREGKVFDSNNNNIKTFIDSKGYLSVVQVKRIRIHRAILLAFEPENEKPIIRHLDGNKLNNNIKNLKWGTAKENILDSIKHGTHISTIGKVKRGEKNFNSKLTNNDILIIRSRSKNEKLIDIAKDYPVCVATIGKIVRLERWKHV